MGRSAAKRNFVSANGFDQEALIDFKGSDGSTYVLARQVAKKGEVTNGEPEKEADKTDKAAGKKASKSVEDLVEREQELWDEVLRSWVTFEREVKDEDDEDYLFTYLLRYRTEDSTDPNRIIKLHDEGLIRLLRQHLTGYEKLLDSEPQIDGRDIFLLDRTLRDVLKRTRDRADALEKSQAVTANGDSAHVDANGSNGLHHSLTTPESLREQADALQILVDYNTKEFVPVASKLARLPSDQITFDLLWTLFRPNEPVSFFHSLHAERMAGEVGWCGYATDNNDQPIFRVEAESREWTGDGFSIKTDIRAIKAFEGLRSTSKLGVQPLTAAVKAQLEARGRLYNQYAGVHHMEYDGALARVDPQNSCKVLKDAAAGRVMIDVASYRRFNPNAPEMQYVDYGSSGSGARGRRTQQVDVGELNDRWTDEDDLDMPEPASPDEVDKTVKQLAEDELYLASPVVFGFSLELKRWGAFVLQGLSPIKWRPASWDHLVLAPEIKDTVKSLAIAATMAVEGKAELLDDVISGKGGGTIILLHGPPGVGKTLTAEAAAELLQRPLYSLSAGDIASQNGLEHSLRKIFETGAIWKAVVLIDEADVFLEARGHNDVYRNSIVSTVLRVLEYQQGLLFLTSNRVKVFDAAVFSRFSLAIKYPDLGNAQRVAVFTRFFKQCGVEVGEGKSVTPADLDRFSHVELNGRVIKRVLQTAQALALVDKKLLSTTYIERTLALQKQFVADFDAAEQ